MSVSNFRPRRVSLILGSSAIVFSVTILVMMPPPIAGIKSLAYSYYPNSQISSESKEVLEDWCRNQCLKSPILDKYSYRVNKLFLKTSKSNYIHTDIKSQIQGPECICMVDKANPLRQAANRFFKDSRKLSSIYTCRYIEDSRSKNAFKNGLKNCKANCRNVMTIESACTLLKDPTLLTAVNLYTLMQNLFELKKIFNTLNEQLDAEAARFIEEARTNVLTKDDRIKYRDMIKLILPSFGNIILYKQAKDILDHPQVKKLLWLAPFWYSRMEAFTWPVNVPDYERCKWFDSDKYRTEVVFASRQEAKSTILNRFIFLFNHHVERKCSKLSDPTSSAVYKGSKLFLDIDFMKMSKKMLRNPDAYVPLRRITKIKR